MFCSLVSENCFCHATVTTPLLRDLIVVELSSHTGKVSKDRVISQEPFLQRV